MPTKTNSSHFAPQSCDKSNFWHFTNKIRLKRRKKSTGTIFKEFKLFVCLFYCISKYIYSLFVSCILKQYSQSLRSSVNFKFYYSVASCLFLGLITFGCIYCKCFRNLKYCEQPTSTRFTANDFYSLHSLQPLQRPLKMLRSLDGTVQTRLQNVGLKSPKTSIQRADVIYTRFVKSDSSFMGF